MNIKPFPEGVTPLDILISSINKKRIKEEIEGVHGYVDKGFAYETRNIEVILRAKAHDTRKYRLLRDEVFSFFNDVKYISEVYQPKKRYKVIATESFIPERQNRKVSLIGITLEMADLPFGIGDTISYKYTGNQFRAVNDGDVSIHPFMQFLKITIRNVAGSTSYFELINKTNGNVFRVNEALPSSAVVVLDGPNITSNGLQFLRKTNKSFIQLETGWNDFEIKGATIADIEFEFPNYYL